MVCKTVRIAEHKSKPNSGKIDGKLGTWETAKRAIPIGRAVLFTRVVCGS
jgi:hypothetical protein